MQVSWDNMLKWHSFLARVPTKPIDNKRTKTHVWEHKLGREASELTVRVEEVKLLLTQSQNYCHRFPLCFLLGIHENLIPKICRRIKKEEQLEVLSVSYAYRGLPF